MIEFHHVWQYLRLLPLAVLTKDDPTETLKSVAKQIKIITDKRIQSNVIAATMFNLYGEYSFRVMSVQVVLIAR